MNCKQFSKRCEKRKEQVDLEIYSVTANWYIVMCRFCHRRPVLRTSLREIPQVQLGKRRNLVRRVLQEGNPIGGKVLPHEVRGTGRVIRKGSKMIPARSSLNPKGR